MLLSLCLLVRKVRVDESDNGRREDVGKQERSWVGKEGRPLFFLWICSLVWWTVSLKAAM